MITPTPFYLDQINPLRGLNSAGLVALQELAMLGYFSRLQWTYFFIEKKSPVGRAVKRRLLSSLSGLDWTIKLNDTGDDADKKALAEKQQTDLLAAYNKISNLRAALTFLALADLRGFSHCNKIYAGATDSRTGRPFNEDLDPWDVVELRIVDQWFWSRKGFYGDWLYNREARETNTGDPIDLAQYVIHRVDDPADEIIAEIEIKRRTNDADWDGFLEDYGIPAQFFVLPPNVPKEREAEFQRAAELAISAARGSVPNGTTMLSPAATLSGGAGVFKERLQYLDEQIVIAGTAGKLTVLSEAGSGTLAGNAQKEAFDEIAQAILNQVATALHKQFDEPLINRLYPGKPVLAYFEFAQINVKDTSEVFDDAAKAQTAGFAMEEEELSERTGYKLTYVGVSQQAPGSKLQAPNKEAASPGGSAAASGDVKPNTPAQPSSPVSALPDPVSAVAGNLHLTAQFVAPAKSVIDDLLAQAQKGDVTNEQLAASAEEFLKRIPEIAETTDVSEVADALEKAMRGAVEATVSGK
jgi:Protein of unknown function (DUF935)